MSTPMITLDDVKAQLPIRSGNASYDDRITLIIAAVWMQIEGFCRRSFEKQVYTEIFHVQNGGKTVYDFFSDTNVEGFRTEAGDVPYRLSHDPIVPDTLRVFYDRSRRFDAGSEIDASYVTLLPERNAFYVSMPMRNARDALKVTYEAGYTTLPEDVKLAAVTQAVHLFSRLDSETVTDGDDRDKTPPKTANGLLLDVVQLLLPYRKQLRGRG